MLRFRSIGWKPQRSVRIYVKFFLFSNDENNIFSPALWLKLKQISTRYCAQSENVILQEGESGTETSRFIALQAKSPPTHTHTHPCPPHGDAIFTLQWTTPGTGRAAWDTSAKDIFRTEAIQRLTVWFILHRHHNTSGMEEILRNLLANP